MSVKRTGVIGLGAMGFQMARHMVNRGFDVTGFDIAPGAVGRAADAGVKIAATRRKSAAGSEVVIVMVATGKQVEDVVAHSGLLDHLAAGSVICVSSSTSPETARELEQLCDARGIGFMDTPVVLGQEAADEGTLTVFCGGTEGRF